MFNRLFFIKNVLLVIIALIFNFKIALAEVSNNPPPRTINVLGHAKVPVTPDIAYLNFSVRTENNTVSEAVSSNHKLSEQVAAALKKFQIDPKDIQTSNFSIYQQQEYDDKGKPKEIISYHVDNSVFTTLRDISKLGSVISAAVNSGSNSISGLQFDVANREKFLTDAKKAAVTDALEQAKELAAAANVTLGNILTINSYNTNSIPMPVYAERSFAKADVSSATPISAGQLELNAEVNVVFEIK